MMRRSRRGVEYCCLIQLLIQYDDCHTKIATSSTNSRNDEPRITRLPLVAKATLAMTVWARSGGCHTEIATAFSKPRNDGFIIAMTVWGHCLPS